MINVTSPSNARNIPFEDTSFKNDAEYLNSKDPISKEKKFRGIFFRVEFITYFTEQVNEEPDYNRDVSNKELSQKQKKFLESIPNNYIDIDLPSDK